MTRAELRAAFAKPNAKAFYMVVRKGESSVYPDAYSMVNKAAPDDEARGVLNHKFYDFSKHPYEGMSTKQGGYAAGAPQYIPSTWRELADRYGFTGFTPQEQDEGFIGCLVKRGALDDVLAGRFNVAVAKCRLEWTSLPGAGESNASWTMEKARSLYQSYGGSFDDGTQPAAPIEDRSTYEEKVPMAPLAILSIFGPIISQLIPQIAKLFDKKVETPEKIVAAQAAIDVFTRAALPGKVDANGSSVADVAAAVEAVKNDPAVLEKVTQKVLMEPMILSILEVGGGVAKAREQDLLVMQQEKPFWKSSPVFWISIIMMPIVFWLVGSLIAGGMLLKLLPLVKEHGITLPSWVIVFLSLFGDVWNGESRSGGFNLVIGLILGGICGVYYGVSVTQQRAGSNNLSSDNKQV